MSRMPDPAAAVADGAPSARQPAAEAGRAAGMLLGLLGVLVFSATLPMTRLAVVDMNPVFIGIGRATVAGLAAALLLAWRRPPLPSPRQWRLLLETALGVVIGFPLFSSIAMKQLPAAHGAIIIGLLPLATAVAALLLARERPSTGFWLCALTGTGLVIAFALVEGGGLTGGDAALLMAVALGALGYARGGMLSRDMPGDLVISWALVLSLPLTAAVTLWTLAQGVAFSVPIAEVQASSWAALLYVSLFSMWIGFFFWYRGLAAGGVARVGQIQLLQPFFTVLIAALMLGETLSLKTVAFAVAVIATVAIGRRMPVRSSDVSR
jgi:drug/metabolite transporter (DMT)-like permease